MSIATKLGDGGQTSLIGGARVSKADRRVEAYGTVDELNSFLGLARSLCEDAEIRSWTETIQRTLFRVGGSLANPAADRSHAAAITEADTAQLTLLVEEIEATPGILSDWSLPGAHTGSAAYEVARTICRRAERDAVRLMESGIEVSAELLAYLNRLSDLLWLFGRRIELQSGVDSRLRPQGEGTSRWSRAW